MLNANRRIRAPNAEDLRYARGDGRHLRGDREARADEGGEDGEDEVREVLAQAQIHKVSKCKDGKG